MGYQILPNLFFSLDFLINIATLILWESFSLEWKNDTPTTFLKFEALVKSSSVVKSKQFKLMEEEISINHAPVQKLYAHFEIEFQYSCLPSYHTKMVEY